jgi:predicted nuclease of predicted toxin-antitoxin system
LKFLIDMNLSPSWVDSLGTLGFSAVHWTSVGPQDALDSEVLAFAKRYDYVLLTHDLDFGAILASTLSDSPSVVQLRAGNLDPNLIAAEALNAIVKMTSELKAGALVIVQPGSSRVRLLPITPGQ